MNQIYDVVLCGRTEYELSQKNTVFYVIKRVNKKEEIIYRGLSFIAAQEFYEKKAGVQ